MLLTLKWMDTLTEIKHHQRFCYFSFPTYMSKICYFERKCSLLVANPGLYGGPGFATNGRTGKTCLTPSLPWLQTTYWKKVSIINFRQILPKILLVMDIFKFIIGTYLKKFIRIKSPSTIQSPAKLSTWIIPPISIISPPSSCLLPPACIDCPVPSPKPTVRRKPWGWKKNLGQK